VKAWKADGRVLPFPLYLAFKLLTNLTGRKTSFQGVPGGADGSNIILCEAQYYVAWWAGCLSDSGLILAVAFDKLARTCHFSKISEQIMKRHCQIPY